MVLQGYYNEQGTLTTCLDCMHDLYTEGEVWVAFPSNWEDDTCTECGEVIGTCPK